MRNPSIHQLAGVRHDRGLSNYLTGEDNIDFLTFPMEDLGFTAMSAGPLPPNAAELLTGGRLSQLIAKLRSEEHTSELQSLMRISYAVFCLKKKKLTIRI